MLNPYLEEKLQTINTPPFLRFLVEMQDAQFVPEAVQQFLGDQRLSVLSTAFNFITVAAPLDAIPALEAVGITVHYDMPRTIYTAPSIADPVVGTLSASPITLPLSPIEMAVRNARNAPFAVLAIPGALGLPLGKAGPKIVEPDVVITTTGDVRKTLKLPEDTFIRNTRVAVLDTGISIPHPLLNPVNVRPTMRSTIGEPPIDALGHGMWCTTAAFGGRARTRFGDVQGVATVVGDNLMHGKCLSTLGFGTSSSVLKAMEQAVEFGARVISMSLGGPLQGSVRDDPECRIIEALKDTAIFVVAAGNSGPDYWTIGSPGASPFALTVGAYSTHYRGLAAFSSRGPSGEWYRGRQKVFDRDSRVFADELMKPDCVAPGGGPVAPEDRVDTIYSGVTGWTNGMNDRSPLEPFDSMRGTSMATPIVAGIVALGVEHDLVENATDVKQKLAARSGKGPDSGYGFLTYDLLS